jgi:hypothetical protein
MNLEVYTFSCLLKEYDEDYEALTYQEQYETIHEYYKDYAKSKQAKNSSELTVGMVEYLEDKYSSIDMYDSFDLDDEDD